MLLPCPLPCSIVSIIHSWLLNVRKYFFFVGWLRSLTIRHWLGRNISIYFYIVNLYLFPLFLDVCYSVTLAVSLHLLMTVTEMVVMRCIYILKFSTIAAMNEYFISTTLTSFNMVIIAINIILRLATREMETSPLYLHHNPQLSNYNLRTDVQNNVVR